MLSCRLGLAGRKMILNSLNGVEFYRNSLWGRYMFLQIFGTFSKVLPCYHHERDSKQKPLSCIYQSSHVQIHLVSSKSFQAPALSSWPQVNPLTHQSRISNQIRVLILGQEFYSYLLTQAKFFPFGPYLFASILNWTEPRGRAQGVYNSPQHLLSFQSLNRHWLRLLLL